MRLFLACHPDDEALFGLDILIEQKPLVVIVTHAKLQGDNGYERALESYKAIQDLGLTICYLQIDEDKLTEEFLADKLKDFYTTDVVYVPDTSDNPQHNLVKKVAEKMFLNIYYYPNYLDGVVNKETKYPKIRKKVLQRYQTQINYPDTKHYFV